MRRIFSAAMAATALAACSDSTGSGKLTASDGMGTLTVRMTDKPFPFAEVASVNIYVVRIDARNVEPTDEEASAAMTTSGWTTIATPNTSIDILKLQGGVTTNLGSSTLATGNYNGFRMVIDPARSNVILKDGSSPEIKFPSAAQSGIKINLDQPIVVTEDSSVMVLDFDLGKSFVMRGNSISKNGLLFKPVIRAVATELTGAFTGSVRGDSLAGAAMPDATVEVLKAGTLITDTVTANIVATTKTDANGNYAFNFLLPGTYVVRATPGTPAYGPALLTGGVTITSGTTVSDQVIVVKTALSGSVRGDSLTGALLPDVTVQVLKAGTLITDTVTANVVATTKTDANGIYKFGFLESGTYVVRATPLAATLYQPALLPGGVVIVMGTPIANQVIVVKK